MNYLKVFRPSQPCSLPMWILMRSLDRIGLRFISQRKERENFSTLMDYPQAIIIFFFILLASPTHKNKDINKDINDAN